MVLQSNSPEVEWLRLGVAAGLGFFASLIAFRLRLYSLNRDINDEKTARTARTKAVDDRFTEIEELIAESVSEIKLSNEAAHARDVASDIREDRKSQEGIASIRSDNEAHHKENTERLRIMRQQVILMVQLMAKIARGISSINQDEVDMMVGRVLAIEVERD